MNDESIIHIQIEASTLEELRAFTDEIQPDLGCRAIPRRAEGRFVIDAYLPETQLQAARGARTASRVSLRTIENSTEIGRERQKEVAEGNRFEVRGEIPQGLGSKE
ncbi:MAG: hypothetical protein LC775_13180 [Acidobacteria bacterium]|nr:hypothetical protein [Acidobacteriota bacterium]